MLKEIIHFAAHAPETLALKRKLTHVELFDTLMLRGEEAGMAAWRTSLVEDVQGRVLEIGCGTGLMFNYYSHRVRLCGLELDVEFLAAAKQRADKSKAQVSLTRADGQLLPFNSDMFDYVIIALVLCSVPSVPVVLNEVRRVLKIGGELRLIEHVRSNHRLKGLAMDILNPLWLLLNGQGCNMNRNTEILLEENGFRIKGVKSFKVLTPGLPCFPKRWIISVPE